MKPVMKAAAVVALCLAVAPASADSARVEVRATVPVSCNLQHGDGEVVTLRPLLMRMPITRDCNTTHTVTVTYDPDVLSNPNLLVMALGAITPTSKAPGVVTFANLPYTNSTRILRIGYAGPEVERVGIRDSVGIDVSPD
ncbi:MAG: hypothetical protein SGI91_00285 [Alphaproteobacteria bacterium]|jgi:hypothetical protein|nr:hypothetical protein [Alphaproteobacteria bacterium]